MLPKIDYPIISIKVHSLGRGVTFRPFLVKEEKLLLIAKESSDVEDVRKTVIQIINNCCLDDKVDVEKLPLYDVEMIFVKLRAASVGESVQLVFNCKNEVDGVVCGTDTDYQLDLTKVEYEIPKGLDDKIMLTDKVGIKLTAPTLEQPIDFGQEEDELYATVMSILFNHVECVFDEESVYKPDQFTKEEFLEFIDNLSVEALERIQTFFTNQPKVVLNDVVKCKKCGYEHNIHSEDLLGFFI